MLLEKFSYSSSLTKETKEEVSAFVLSQTTFKEFSEKAQTIRNDEFVDNPDLINDFDKRLIFSNTKSCILHLKNHLSISHKTIPILTDTLNECFVPN